MEDEILLSPGSKNKSSTNSFPVQTNAYDQIKGIVCFIKNLFYV
jgi:hypothetical protein